VNTLGELERAVLEHLWTAAGPVTATQLRDDFADRGLALTTVHTVLTRLQQKGFVDSDESRPRQFRARSTREDHVAHLMREVLGQAGDRQAALARFVGSVGDDEVAMLRELLAGGGDAPAGSAT
jgi:predicted transcriptional regulator